MTRTPLTLAMAWILAAHCPAQSRTWTNTDGTRTFQAEFLHRDAANVTLRMKPNREVTLEIAKLHDTDRQWLEQQHPLEKKETPGAEPNEAAVFDQLCFGDTRDNVAAKLKASTLVETEVAGTFMGRTGLNGIYRTRKPVGGLHCFLYFDWDEKGGLKEITLRTEEKAGTDYDTKLQPCWHSCVDLVSPIYGKALQAIEMPTPDQLQDGQMLASHLWKIEQGGSVLLGVAKIGENYQVAVRFTSEEIRPHAVP